MREIDQEQRLIRNYLLGDLPVSDREHFEEQVLVDIELSEIASIVEDELVDDYAAGSLSPVEREKFVRHYLLSSHQSQKVQLAMVLSECAQREAETQLTTVPRTSRAARIPRRLDWLVVGDKRLIALVSISLLLIVIVGSWMLIKTLYERNLRAEIEKEILQLNSGQNSITPDIQVTLSPLDRGQQETTKVFLKPASKVVQFQLELPNKKYQMYRVMFRMTDGSEIFPPIDLPADSENPTRLSIKIPARLLGHQDYRLTLSGLTNSGQADEVGNYFFRVVY